MSAGAYLKLLGHYLRPHKPRVALLAVFIFGYIGVRLSFPQIGRFFIDTARADGPLDSLMWAAGFYLIAGIGLNILYLTLIGALFVFFYTWPLKHFALGELAVLLVWGPLMTAGSYYVLTEGLTLQVFLVSLVVGAGPTLVILGKHMDKYKQDCILTIRTLPVVIGLRASRVLSVLLIAGQWLLITYLVLNSGYGFLACALSLPALKSLLTSVRADRSLAKPDDFQEEEWPLWHSAFAFSYCRNFGFALLLGLIANTIFLSVA